MMRRVLLLVFVCQVALLGCPEPWMPMAPPPSVPVPTPLPVPPRNPSPSPPSSPGGGRSSGDVSYGSSDGGIEKKKDREITMTTGTPVVLGSLDPEIIRRIVREHGEQVRYCYESELTRTPGLYGKVVMKWVISRDGKVMSVTIAETQMKNANVENCLASRIKTWVFPKPNGGGIVLVNYPFVFKQSG